MGRNAMHATHGDVMKITKSMLWCSTLRAILLKLDLPYFVLLKNLREAR
jgi:hypothetical protein